MAKMLVLAILLFSMCVGAQERSMEVDKSLDNLVHPHGTVTTPIGQLGRVNRMGTGSRAMILIPGLGFGGDVFDSFMNSRKNEFTMFAVTLPGFGSTPPLPVPEPSTDFSGTPWTNSAVSAIERLIADEQLQDVVVVAHWALATQIGIRLAAKKPNRVSALVLIAGVARAHFSMVPDMANWTIEKRHEYASSMGERWFKFVKRKTWDDNNFMTYDYARNPMRALFLWRAAATPSVGVWARYLLEFYATDSTPLLAETKVPTLLVQPEFDDPEMFVDQGRNYMRDWCFGSWMGLSDSVDHVQRAGIGHSRLFVMYDQPEALDRVVNDFLSKHTTANK